MFITILLAGILLGAATQIPSTLVRVILLLLTALIALGASASLDRRSWRTRPHRIGRPHSRNL